MDTPITIALSGTLQRHVDGWHWSDGTPEPRARDMLLSHIAPNFRCGTHSGIPCVEIPHDWRDARYWPQRQVDPAAARAVDDLLKEGGREAAIWAEQIGERLDDHRLTMHGHIVSVALWDAALREVCGVWWDSHHEADILARAAKIAGGDAGYGLPG